MPFAEGKLLEGKVAIVTGAAHPDGMGFAACRKLVQAGARVVVTDLAHNDGQRDNIEKRAADLITEGGEALALAVDVSDRSQINACVRDTIDAFGTVDILFNNAGTPVGCGDFLQMDEHQWDLSYQVNLKGAADFCQAVLPVMVDQGQGTIINNSSLAGLAAIADMAAYTATKFGVVGLTKTLAAEFGSRGIRVNAVCPGMIWTQMGEQELDQFMEPGESRDNARQRLIVDVPLARWGSADDVANAVLFLASDLASYISGVALPVAGGQAPGL